MHNKRRQNGQSLVEFSIVGATLFGVIVSILTVLFVLFQTWGLSRAVDRMGYIIVTGGQWDEAVFSTVASQVGVAINPNNDTLLVAVTSASGDVTTYSWGDGDVFKVNYGDLVTIRFTKRLSILGNSNLPIPDASVSWNGVAQRNSGSNNGGGGAPSSTGSLSGRVVDASGNPLNGVTITVNPGSTSTATDNQGYYSINALDPGSYTVTASKVGYQTATSTVNVFYGSSVVRNFMLQSGAKIYVTLNSQVNLINNPSFESGNTTPWSVGNGTFGVVAADNFSVTGSDSHSGGYAGFVTTNTNVSAGIMQNVSSSFAAGVTYRARVYLKAPNGTAFNLYFGDPNTTHAQTSATASGAWQLVMTDWTPSTTSSSATLAVQAIASGGGGTIQWLIDDAEIRDLNASVSGATVRTSDGLIAVEDNVQPGLYHLTVEPGQVSISAVKGSLSGSATVSVSPGSTTYLTITMN